MKVIILLAILGLIAVAVAAVFGKMSRKQLISKEDLAALRKRDSLAENALLNIAGNTSGNPVLDAQVALSERARTYEIKEIK